MVSMAGASLMLPFLPLTAGQILLNNFLSDVPAIGTADDSVDPELVDRPRRWDIRFIGRYMMEFGVLSSVFDVATFVTLLVILHAAPDTFLTGWFVESLLTEPVVALVVRTRRPFFKSRPGKLLLVSTVCLIAVAVVVPYLPFTRVLGFVRLPGALLVAIVVITMLYVVATEVQKRWFYRRCSPPSRIHPTSAMTRELRSSPKKKTTRLLSKRIRSVLNQSRTRQTPACNIVRKIP
jgi:P-type Mg2+ transporter